MPDEARITLISHGVVEAPSKDGELYGFERTRAISNRKASEITNAAKQFGQQDESPSSSSRG